MGICFICNESGETIAKHHSKCGGEHQLCQKCSEITTDEMMDYKCLSAEEYDEL